MSRRKRLSADPFLIEIEALLPTGRGSAMHEGKPLEVHDALAEETVMARHLFGRRFRGQARAVEVLHPSPQRTTPRCPHFGTCSACVLQHMNGGAQRAFKQDVLLETLERKGGVKPETILPALAADEWHYRRKARLSVRLVPKKGKVLLGFRERDGRFVTDMQECHILAPVFAGHVAGLADLLNSMDAAAHIPQIEVSCGDDDCALVFRHLEPLGDSDIGKLRAFARATGLAVLLQPKGPETITPLEPAEPALEYALPKYGLEFRFQPLDFIQVNGALNREMIDQAIQQLALENDDEVLDLFCGLGNFTLPLATRVSRVTGVEGDEALVTRARDMARHNELTNVEFRLGDLHGDAAGLEWSRGRFDKVLMDPPRSGAGPVLEAVARTATRRIVYVSCNPETLAEDAGELVREHGFTLRAVGMMDMFPQTTHIEAMAVFERNVGEGP